MELNKKPWPVLTVCSLKARIDPTPDYQRPAVWSRAQKQLLVDTILRGYDIPKFDWRKVGKAPDRYEVVDGQQRLRTVWEFQSGDFALAQDADDVDGERVAKARYDDLPDDLRIRFDTYPLDVVVIDGADEEEVRELFLRLQNGTSLKAQEKRNAMSGEMRDFVKALAQHPFFTSCAFENSRYTHDLVAAQMTLLELEGGPTNIKNADLNRMYRDNVQFKGTGGPAGKIRRTLNFLYSMFPAKTPELERYNAISLYILVSHLLERYAVTDRAEALAKWFIEFESYRRTQRDLPTDEADIHVVTYQERTSHSTDSEDSLQWRHDYLLSRLLDRMPDLALKDDQRIFTHDQRLAIYRRDSGVCQVKLRCDGAKCEWDHWEADHITPWSKGGRTTVANGQVACPLCNYAKNNITMAAA
jgi:hypothetical protein